MKGKLTISRPQYHDNRKTISIQVKDELSRTIFLDIEISCANFAECLTGMSEMECELKTRDLDKVGLKKETKSITFEFPEGIYTDRKEIAYKMACKIVNANHDGWIVSGYFGSKGSFFTQDGISMARADISRWI